MPLFRLSTTALSLLLAACASHPPEAPLPQPAIASEPAITVDPRTGEHSTTISVLTYNVAGVPWPLKSGRGAALEAIGRKLGLMRERGEEPDIVLLQEAFTARASRRLIELSGYPNVVRGPRRTDQPPEMATPPEAEALERPRIFKGEGLGKWTNAGLYILSNFPIVDKKARPFRYCAGYDCLANKGALLARIEMPSMPVPIDVFNTHLNARVASGVAEERALLAHNLQVDELDRFVDSHLEARNPLIFGGDFNTRNSPARFDHAMSGLPYDIVRHYCTVVVDDCELQMSFDSDAPWLDTQDLQGFHDGTAVRVRPIRVAALFDEPVDGELLSDHDGYLVHYRLSWSRSSRSQAPAEVAP